MSHNGRLDSTLLNGRRFFETIRVDATEKFLGQSHSIKCFNGFIPVGLEIGIRQSTGGGFTLGRPFVGWRGFAVVVNALGWYKREEENEGA